VQRVGRYSIVREIGRGGMAVVYEAVDPDLRRRVALKVLHNPDERFVARLHKEAAAAARLRHPNIVAVHEVGTDESDDTTSHFIAMDLIEGRTLAEAASGLSLDVRIALLESVARAAGHAHAEGIVHRDLKPQNVIVEERDDGPHAWLTDFGLAKIADGSPVTQTGAVVGTPVFMAPEQVQGDVHAVTPRSDVWGLGVMLYQMLSGRVPFEGATALDIYAKILADEPAPPTGAPVDLATVCLKAMEKDPRRRYADATEFADELARWRQREPVRARPASAWTRASRRVRRHPAVVAATAALVLAAAAGGTALVVQKVRADRRVAALHKLQTTWSTIVERKRELRLGRVDARQARRELEEAIAAVAPTLAEWPDEPQGWYVRARGRLYLGDLAGAQSDLRTALEAHPDFRPGWSLLGAVLMEQHQSVQSSYARGLAARQARTRSLIEEALRAFERGWPRGVERAESERWGLAWTREDEVLERMAAAMRLYYLDGKADDARRVLDEAVRRFPAEEFAVWLGLLAGRDDAARERWLQQAVAWAPGYALAWHDLGNFRFARDDVAGAEAAYTRAIDLEPNHAAALHNRAVARGSLGDIDGSLADFARAIALRREPEPYCSRGVVRAETGDFAGARADFDEAIRLDPQCASGWHGRAALQHRQGDASAALADYARAIELDGTSAKAWCDRGRAWLDLRQPARAIEDIEKSLSLEKTFDAWYHGAEARQHLGDLDGAIADYARAIDLRPDDPIAYNARGTAYHSMGRLDEALTDFNRAIAARPDHGTSYVNRGNLKRERRDLDGANADLDRAVALLPTSPEARLNRGALLKQLGRPEEAIADFDRAIELRPKFPEALANRGFVRAERGELVGAKEDLEAALAAATPDWPHRATTEQWLERVRAMLAKRKAP